VHVQGAAVLQKMPKLSAGVLDIVLSALVALNFSDFPVGVESGEGLDAARTKLRRMRHIAAIAVAVNYASVRHIAKYFALGRKL